MSGWEGLVRLKRQAAEDSEPGHPQTSGCRFPNDDLRIGPGLFFLHLSGRNDIDPPIEIRSRSWTSR